MLNKESKSKFISVIITISLIFTLIFETTVSSNALINIASQNNPEASNNPKILFKPNKGININKLQKNKIILYVENIPIYAGDISKDNTIKKEKENIIKKTIMYPFNEDSRSNFSSSAKTKTSSTFLKKCMKKLPYSKQNRFIIVQAQMTAVNFSQKEVHVYLPKPTISKYAIALEKKSRVTLKDLILGFIPYFGASWTIASFLKAGSTYKAVDELRKYKRARKAAWHSTYKSSYGWVQTTGIWNKKTIQGKNYKKKDKSNAKYIVKKISYGKKKY